MQTVTNIKQIVIVGAGALANDFYTYLQFEISDNLSIKGVITDNKNDYEASIITQKYLGTLNDYVIEDNDLLFIAIGENSGRVKVIDFFKEQGASFYTFVHPSSIIHPSSSIKEGAMIGPFSIIGSNAVVKENVFINKFCNIGHNSIIGKGSIMYPYAMVGGYTTIGDNVLLSTRCTISPNVNIGDNCVVSAHTFVRKNSEASMFISMSKKKRIINNV
ncbi:MAG TPA: hypothetical protein EYP60_08700 [bacterium (Candidatus Stahlbacteria)]|nr:hypothetical protein [Candidatus Stahlbacteria bacterium]